MEFSQSNPGSRGEASCYQDDRAFLFPESSLYRHGASEHKSLRIDQGQQFHWIYHNISSTFYYPDASFSGVDASSSHCSL